MLRWPRGALRQSKWGVVCGAEADPNCTDTAPLYE